RALNDAGELDPSSTERNSDAHGDRRVRAIEAVAERCVKQYREFPLAVGHADGYVADDGGRTCKDSAHNHDANDDNQRCWHVLAAAIARRVGALDHHDMWYSDVREFL